MYICPKCNVVADGPTCRRGHRTLRFYSPGVNFGIGLLFSALAAGLGSHALSDMAQRGGWPPNLAHLSLVFFALCGVGGLLTALRYQNQPEPARKLAATFSVLPLETLLQLSHCDF